MDTDKICINKIRCYQPYMFYACWLVILGWMTLSIVLDWGHSKYQKLIDPIGLMGFGGIFIMIIGSFGTISGKKIFLCNVYDCVAKHFKKLLIYELIIVLISSGVGININPYITNGKSHFPELEILGYILIICSVFVAKKMAKLILEKYTGKIIVLCVDVILLPNLLLFVVLSGIHVDAQFLVVLLVFHFLYTLFRIVQIKDEPKEIIV